MKTLNSIPQASAAQRTHSRQPSTEKTAAQNDAVARADPIRPFDPYASTHIHKNKDDEPPQILQTSSFHHPVLADLLSSPLAPKTPMVAHDALPLLPKPQEVRQRTLSSSNGNLVQLDMTRSRDFVPEVFPSTKNPSAVRQRTLSSSAANQVALDLEKAREVANSPKKPQEARQRTLSSSNVNAIPSDLVKAPLERLEKEVSQYVPSHRYPSESDKRTTIAPIRDEQVTQDTRVPPTRPPVVQPDFQAEPIRQSSSQRHHTEYPQKVARGPSRDILTQETTRNPSGRLTVAQQIPAPVQETESPLALPTDTIRQVSAQQYISERSQRPYGDTAREGQPIQQADSATMQWSSGRLQAKDVPPTYQVDTTRQTSYQRYPIEPLQRTVTEQLREASASYEPRTTAVKAPNVQSSPVAQTRQGNTATAVSDPPILASRVPSSSNPVQTQPNSAPQEAPTEQVTASRHRLGSSATRTAPQKTFSTKYTRKPL